MALFRGGGVEPGLGRREIRSGGLQLPVEEIVPPQHGSTQARALPKNTATLIIYFI